MARMLARAMRTSPWDDGREDREWSMTKRRQRRIEQRETRDMIPMPCGPAAVCPPVGDRYPCVHEAAGEECRHGCSGCRPCSSEACTFVCHQRERCTVPDWVQL